MNKYKVTFKSGLVRHYDADNVLVYDTVATPVALFMRGTAIPFAFVLNLIESIDEVQTTDVPVYTDGV